MILDRLLQRPIAYHRIFADVTGSVTAGLMLSQLWYWRERVPEHDNDGQPRCGWMYKTVDDWFAETRLSYREQAQARKILRGAGLLEEERRGIPAKIWYRLDVDRLIELIERAEVRSSGFDEASVARGKQGKFAQKSEKTQQNQQSAATRVTCVPRCGDQGDRDAGILSSAARATNTETRPGITPETTHPPTPLGAGEEGSVGLLADGLGLEALRAIIPADRLADVDAALRRIADPAQQQLLIAEVVAGVGLGKAGDPVALLLALARKAAAGQLTAGWSRPTAAQAEAARVAGIEAQIDEIRAAAEKGKTILLAGEPAEIDGRFLLAAGGSMSLPAAVADGRVEVSP